MNEHSPKTEPILSVTGLNVSAGSGEDRKEILLDVTFSLAQGRTLGIVGESGSGKSVTSLSIMRLLDFTAIEVDHGEIQFGQERIDLLDTSEERVNQLRGKRIAMIFQEPMSSLNPSHRCGKQVSEMLLIHTELSKNEVRDKVISLFEQVRLPDPERIYSSYPHQLSGGQKQRIMIAMAMACEPELLICDEPTTALDVTVQKSILELLNELKLKTKMSMIFISHDLEVVARVSDDILVMKGGRVVEKGTSSEIMNNPQQDYTRGLLACRPPTDKRPRRLRTIEDVEKGHAEASSESVQDRLRRHEDLYSTKAALRISDLHTWYPIKKGVIPRIVEHVKAVNGVSFEVYKGETLGIVGESGCGKSTLGRTIVGLESAHSGSIQFNGQSTFAMDKSGRQEFSRKVQMIFQDPGSSLNPRLRIGEAIIEPMKVHGLHNGSSERMDRAVELLEKVGLSAEHFDRYPHEFSGGQRQRVNIARTLALRPEIIVCDESVSALDVSVQAQVLNLLNDLKEELGLTYLFISHDLSVVRYMSDRVMVMNQGRIVELQEANELYRSPKEDYSKKLINASL